MSNLPLVNITAQINDQQGHACAGAVVRMRRKYGKNALLKGTNFLKEATGRDRNEQIGGHRA